MNSKKPLTKIEKIVLKACMKMDSCGDEKEHIARGLRKTYKAALRDPLSYAGIGLWWLCLNLLRRNRIIPPPCMNDVDFDLVQCRICPPGVDCNQNVPGSLALFPFDVLIDGCVREVEGYDESEEWY